MESSNNLAGETVDSYYFANRRLDAKKLRPNRFSKDANVCSAVHVVLRKNRSFSHVPALDVEVFGRNTSVRGVPILIPIDDLDGVIHIRRNTLDKGNLALDGHSISHHQCLGIVSAGTHAIHRTASGLNPDKVVPEIVELSLNSGLPGIADGHNANNRGDPNGDTQYRQDGSHLVSQQG